jgi:hypothetical protein
VYKVEAMSSSMWPTLRRAGIVGLLAVALVTLLAEGSQLRHVHESDTLGLYNEQHVVQGLAALTNAAPLPDAPAAAYLLIVVATAAIVEALRLAVPAARHAAPRAPPVR